MLDVPVLNALFMFETQIACTFDLKLIHGNYLLIRFTYLLPVLYLFMFISSILFMYILALYRRFITCILLYFGNVHALVGDWHSFQMRANVIFFYIVRL